MATLSEITDLDPELLEEKFQLEPRIRYDPNQSENLLFLSPLVLLEDLELREGGFQDRGAKEVLSRVAKHICETKDPSLLQVPEITYFYMGYGKKSENKKCQMAINKEEAEVWMGFLNLSRFTRERSLEEGTSTSVEEEVPMDIDFPTPRDTQALDIEDAQQMEDHNSEDSVGPNDNGLQIPLKGSYVLLFSILLIFFEKKQKTSAASTDDEPKIGANKVSDFLLFWIIPYLLNYNHQKVREIVKHHRQVNGRSFTKTVKVSSLKIIQEAMSSCQVSPELKKAIKDKYKDFYGTEQLEYEYNLLATTDGEPVILVPKRYKVSKMPAALEDIGTAWRKLGNVKLVDEFMNIFIKNKEIQKDFLYSLPLLKSRQGVDYAIVFPDEDTFNEVIKQLENDSCEYFSRPKVTSKGGRSLITPRIGLAKNREKHLAVCFSYLQGNTSQRVAALFRAVGAHYLDHFTLALLHGLCLNSCDPQCKVGNLYPVSCIKKMSFKGIRPKKEGEVEDFSEGLGRFCRAEFPETYKSWEEAVKEDTKVKNLMSHSGKLIIDPKFERDAPLTVAYSRSSYTKRLSGSVPFGATFAQTEKGFSKYQVNAVNTNGCLLSMIKKGGRKNNVGVVLIIKDVRGGSLLPKQPSGISAIVAHFTRAVVVAGLPKVYPSEPDEEDRDEIEIGSSEDDDDDDDDDEQPTTSGLTSLDGSASTSGASPGIVFKEGEPSHVELNRLAEEIASQWKPLGLYLGIEQKVLDRIDANEKDKPYAMLFYWSSNSSILVPPSLAPYHHLYNALCESSVGFSNLAREFCCKKTT